MTDAEPVVGATLLRAGVYRLLGGAFGYPAPDRLQEIADLARQLACAPPTPEALREPLARLAAAAAEAEPASLAAEHTFLFDRGVRCPPYESAYGEAASLAGKPAALADIAGFYRAFGLAPAHARPDLEDHVAAECEFMSALGVKEAYALAQGHAEGLAVTRGAQVAFFSDHLGRWAEALGEAVDEATPVPYYRAVADLLRTWVREEAGTLNTDPVRVRGRFWCDPVQEEESFTCPMVEPSGEGGGQGRPPEGGIPPAPRG